MPRHLEPSRPCACASGLRYGDCCRPFLRGERDAPDPISMMRSRFSAFALDYSAYLWRTLHPTHPDRARPEEEVLRTFRRASRTLESRSLAILDSAPAGADGRAQVLFLARVLDRGRDLSFLERSDFLHDGAGWRYLTGTVRGANDFADPQSTRLSSF